MKQAYLDHLDELRKRLVSSFAGMLCCTIVSFFFISRIINILCVPYVDFLRSSGISTQLVLQSLNPPDAFVMTMNAALLTGFALSLPWTSYQTWSFIGPALYKHEKKYVIVTILSTLSFFIIGCLFAYSSVIPTAISFFYNYSVNVGIQPGWTINGYFNFITTILICFGVVFELPVAVFFLSALGITTPYFFVRYRKHAIIIIFIVAAIFTPPDAASQIMMAVPMMLLYEISILGSKIVYHRRMKRIEAEEALS